MSTWIVTKAESGARLDCWLSERGGLSRKQAKQALDLGRVQLNGRRVVIAKWAMQAGDTVTLHAPRSAAQRERAGQQVRLTVLFEDRDLIAVVKPPGVIVVPVGETNEPTVVDWVRAYLRRRHPGSRGTFVRALHRLDRDTSGMVLLAKSRIGERLINQFKRHTIHREYLALVHGAVAQAEGTINLALRKGEFGHGRKVALAGGREQKAGAKRAVTRYLVEERYHHATYLRLWAETGRTHQIRVHCAALGHPILGDRRYGPPQDPIPVRRQMLHATKLILKHPVSGEPIRLVLPAPEDFVAAQEALRDSA